MIRIGQIGLGTWGGRVLRTLTEDLRDEVTVRWTAGHADWPSKLKTEVDAVVICVPPDAQPVIAKAVLEAGLSVFLEKPLALDPLSARQIHDAASMRGLPVLVDHVWLFHPLFERLKRDVTAHTDGVPNGVAQVECVSGGPGPDRLWPTEHAALWDWGAHDVAMVLELGAHLDGPCKALKLGAPEEGHYRVIWGDHRTVIDTSNVLDAKKRLVRVSTYDGRVWLFDGVAETLAYAPPNAGFVYYEPIDRTPPLTKALRVWLSAVKGDTWDDRIGTKLGLQVTQALQQAQDALEGT